MNTNSLKQNADHSTSKFNRNVTKPTAPSIRAFCLAVAAVLLTTLVLTGHAAAQSACPNVRTFGQHLRAGKQTGETRRVQVQALYFRTEDKSAFFPEVASNRWNSGAKLVRSDDFRGRLEQLASAGKAEVTSRQMGNVFLGDMAELGRGQNALNQNVSFIERAPVALDVSRLRTLDRYTTFSVYRNEGEPFYHLNLLSWFVDAKPDGVVRMTVDLDAGTLLRPGETMLYKFMSDFETARVGSSRTYLALSLVNPSSFANSY